MIVVSGTAAASTAIRIDRRADPARLDRHNGGGHDWAVTTMRAVIEGQYSGQEGSGDYRCTFFWGQPHGRWQLAGLQMTRIEGK